MEWLALQNQAILVGQIMDAAAQNVVLRHDLFNIKCVLDALEAVSRWTAVTERFRDRLVRMRFEGLR